MKHDTLQNKEASHFMGKPASFSLEIELNNINIRSKKEQFFSLTSYPQTHEMSFLISYKNFFFSTEKQMSEFITEKVEIGGYICNCYVFENDFPERSFKPNDLVKVYWTIQSGLIGYKTLNNEHWLKSDKRKIKL